MGSSLGGGGSGLEGRGRGATQVSMGGRVNHDTTREKSEEKRLRITNKFAKTQMRKLQLSR